MADTRPPPGRTCLVFSPNSRLLALTQSQRPTQLWDVLSGKKVASAVAELGGSRSPRTAARGNKRGHVGTAVAAR